MITFRVIEESDLEKLKEWRNDPKLQPYMREYRLLNEFDQNNWYTNYLKQRRTSDWDSELFVMELKLGKLTKGIGVGGFTRIEWKNRKAELSFYIIDDKLIELALFEIVSKGFNEFGFHKIYWPVYGHDPRLETYKKVFVREAILKEEYFYGGKFQDRIYLSLTEAQFKGI